MSHIFTEFWTLPALTEHIKIRAGSSPFQQKLPSAAGEKKEGGKSGKSRGSMTLLLQGEVCESCLCNKTTCTATALRMAMFAQGLLHILPYLLLIT